ncbi:MAG: IclR family transcriptional regulator [Sphingomonadaceae bacterium]|nr:IclR family transcriptional regulator [Sphingomonadaceae bacterium]
MASPKTKAAKEKQASSTGLPRSPLRVMNILEELANAPVGLPLVRLCERLDLPMTSVLNLLRALADAKYVVNHQGLYRLGEAALRLSSRIAVAVPFPYAVHDLLTKLMTRCDETAMLAELAEDGRSAVYIDKVECQRTIRFSNFIGVKRPLHSTAIGRAMLAFQDEAFIKSYLKTVKLAARASRSITDRDELLKRLDEIRKDGVAAAIEEHSEGVGAFAAPVFDASGRVRAAVSIGAPAMRARSLGKKYAEEVRQVGREMSLVLGWQPNLSMTGRD